MKTSAIVSLFLLAALFAALVVLHVVFGRDIPPADVSDLKVVRYEIADADNAFTYLSQITNIYSGTNKLVELLDQLEEEVWDEDYVADILASNSTAFTLIDKGLSCERFQVPEIKGFDAPLMYLSEQRAIGRLIDLKAGWLFRQGKKKEAFEASIRCMRLGALMQDSGGGIINYLVAIAVKGISHERIEGIIRQGGLSSGDMRRYAAEVKEYESCDPGFENSLRVEYVFGSSAVDLLVAGKDGSELFGTGVIEMLARRSSYVFQPNRTKKRMAELCREMESNALLPYTEIEWPLDSAEEERGVLGGAERLLKPNAVGRVIFDMMQPAYDAYFERKCRCVLYARSIRLLLALKAYERDKGELPQALDQLVPQYIDAAPIDPYDGEPLRYSAERRLFYSVGRDGEDSGGTIAPDKAGVQLSIWKRRDIIFSLDVSSTLAR